MRGLEAGEARQQPADGEGADRADGEQFPAPADVEAGQRGRDPVERVAKHRQQGLPLVGQRETPGQAAEERGAEPVLQRLDLVAERRGG